MIKVAFFRVCTFMASRLVFAVVTAAISTSVLAQGSCGPSGTGSPTQPQSSCDATQPASQTNANEPAAGAGNPINVITGNKYQQEVDMAALPGELGVELVRHYNSLATSDTGHVGRGWRLSYETEIRFEGVDLALIQADGKRYQFKCAGALCRTQDWADGVVVIRASSDGVKKTYVWRWLAGSASRRELTFDDRGLLMSIRSGSGAVLSIERLKDGRIQEVVDPQGRKLVFHYPSLAQLTAQPARFNGVMAIDTPLGRVEYAHGSAVPLGVISDAVTTVRGRNVNAAYVQRQSNLVSAQMTGEEFREVAAPKRQYHYESALDGQPAFLTGISINGIRQSTYLYDKGGLAVLSTKGEPARLAVDPQGVVLTPNRLADGTGVEQVGVMRKKQGQSVLVNSLGVETVYKHGVVAGQHRLLEVRGPGCSTCGVSNVRFEYGKQGLLNKQIALDANGVAIQATEYERDAYGRIAVVKVDSKVLSSFTYAGNVQDKELLSLPLFEIAVVKAPSVVPDHWVTRTYERNSVGQIVSETVRGWSPAISGPTSVAMETKFGYEAIAGKSVLTAITLPSSIASFQWDERANYIASVTRSNQGTVAYGYDAAGRTIEAIFTVGTRALRNEVQYIALNVVSKRSSAWFYHDGKVDQTTLININPQRFNFNQFAQLIETIDPVGRRKRFGYDQFGRLNSEIDAAGYGAKIDINSEGSVQRSATTYKNQIVRATYAWHDEYGRVSRTLQPDGRMDDWQFDAMGRVASHFNSDNVYQRFARSQKQVSNFLQLSESVDGEARWSSNLTSPALLRVDDLGRIVFQVSKDHGRARFVYDDSGKLKEKVRGDGVTEQFAYDNAGQMELHRWVSADGELLDESQYKHENGLLRTATNTHQSTEYIYDALGRVVSEHVRLLGLTKPSVFTTKTKYDAHSNQVLSRTLFDGRVIRVSYADSANGAYPTVLALEAGWISSLRNSLGKSFANSVDSILPSTRIATGIKVTPLNGLEAYTLGNGLSVHRHFDLAGRLIELNNQGIGKTTYGYQTGPRIRRAETSTLKSVPEASASRLDFVYSSFGELRSTSVGLDDTARAAQDISNKYMFNVANQLKEIRNGVTGMPIANYTYNVAHQRVRKVVFSNSAKPTERFYLWQANKIAAEVDSGGNVVKQYVYINDGTKSLPIAQLNSSSNASEIFYIHNEHRGAPAAMTDEHRNIVWKANSNINGIAQVENAAHGVELNLRLPGQYFDAESNLHDNFHRTYNPSTGRYLQADPLGYPDGPDSYLYASGDPVNKVDPLGLYEIDVHYYMTFFLARVAGVGYQEALTIASATQYIDDNPRTWPVDEQAQTNNLLALDARNRLASYHFTTSQRDVISHTNYDPSRSQWEAAVSIASGGTLEASSYINRRFYNPNNPQLTRLSATYNRGNQSRCERAQFFGEYLHAFEDTFGHRNQLNVPIELNLGLGHALYGHSPDKTYNHSVSAEEVLSRQGIEKYTILEIGDWLQNESRSLRMEEEVFEKLLDYRSKIQSNLSARTKINFDSDLRQFLVSWNKIKDGSIKITELEFKLNEFGLGDLPSFSVQCAKAKRDLNLWNLDGNPSKYGGAILQLTMISLDVAKENVKTLCG
jgi:RHS repeat-associated protein